MATRVQDFQEKLKQTSAYSQYQQAVVNLKSDANAYQLLQELIAIRQDSPRDPHDWIVLEQEIERCEPLQDYFQLERKYLEEYNRISHEVFGKAAVHCGPLGRSNCEGCKQGCHK